MSEHIDILIADEAWRRWNEEDGVTDEGHAVIAARLARIDERAKIVAWLRDGASNQLAGWSSQKALITSATDIEAGEHLK